MPNVAPTGAVLLALVVPDVANAVAAMLLAACVLVVFAARATNPKKTAGTEPSFDPDPAKFDELSRQLKTDDASASATFAKWAQDAYRERVDRIKRQEDKAASMLGLVGGGLSLVAIITGPDKVLRLQITPLLYVGVGLFVGVLICTLLALRPKNSNVFTARRIADTQLLTAQDGEARINAIAGWTYVKIFNDAAAEMRYRGGWFGNAQICFAFAAIAIVLNTLLPKTDAGAGVSPVRITCTSNVDSTRCESNLNVDGR